MQSPQEKSVDVAINAYGKPYQTAVTLLSLMKHSGCWIDKIYFVEEKKQPFPTDFQLIRNALGRDLVYFKPKFWFWVDKIYGPLRKLRPYRQAIRYQYAWEKTDKDYLLVIHNDVLFSDDLVGAYLRNIGDHAGIGKIGQCWNCPASLAGVCNSTSYLHYRPDYEEVMQLSARHPGARSHLYADFMDKNSPWPLPECRLNEYVALINMKQARPMTAPVGKIAPFGLLNRIDIGVEWFSGMNNAGFTFTHFDYDPYATHSWISLKNSGHDALFNNDLYDYEESVARQCLIDEFGYTAGELAV